MGIRAPDDYLEMASSQLHAAQALRDDLLAVLFPHGSALPSELLQTRVKLKLLALVDSIERQLIEPDGENQRSWELLAKSGLLREKALVHFALARLAEDRLVRNMQAAGMTALSQIPATLLGHENPGLAELARQLLQAEQAASGGDERLYQRLDGELLHQLCWRVVAALQNSGGDQDRDLVSKAEALLARHGDMGNPAAVARKLVFFMGSDGASELADPRRAGLHLFIAVLAKDYGIENDLLLRLISEGSVAPLLLLLKGQDVAAAQLPAILTILRGSDDDDLSSDLSDTYGALDRIQARAAISKWAAEAA